MQITEDAKGDKVQCVELQFLPNQSKDYNFSSTQLRKQAHCVNVIQLSENVSVGFSTPSSGYFNR